MYSIGMKLSAKSEYACLALIDLARRHREGPVTIEDIAVRQGIPKKYLEQILLQLKGAGFVKSRRGAEGGYALARPPESISVAEVLRALDGGLAPVASASRFFYSQSPVERSAPLLGLMKEIRDVVARKLEATTFADLAGRG